MNSTRLLWSAAMVGISIVSVAFGYLIDIWVGAVFWLLLTMMLILARPI